VDVEGLALNTSLKENFVAVEFVKCPTCKQKLAILEYMTMGTLVVCANLKCGTSLRLNGRRPVRVEVVPEAETYKVDYRPESYG
jgi:ssDNA-binding Zn-finger/Zn-ribbon topoisomerase 1